MIEKKNKCNMSTVTLTKNANEYIGHGKCVVIAKSSQLRYFQS